MKIKTPKHLLQAHRLICGQDKLLRKDHGKAEFNLLADVRKIFEDRNIVGIGIAEKMTDNKRTGELCLRFYVKKKIAKKRSKSNMLIPPVISVGGREATYTDVFETGVIRGQLNVQSTPIQSGFSVSHRKAANAGTLGAIVKNGSRSYILSNSHVLARNGNAALGDEVIYPGKNDGPPRPVAKLSDFTKLDSAGDNEADAALAEIDPNFANSINHAIFEANSLPRPVAPARLMEVVGFGRTTGKMRGVIDDIDFHGVILISNTNFNFIHQVSCTRYSNGGDSGALMVDKASGNIVGLHVAGSETISIFSPITTVMDRLSLKFHFA